tara:strand:+ start:161 stop:1018 length:858 start_codon:yes stop_codon:yes gene_type:complete
MARVIGNVVLPDLPYSPNMAQLPQVNITRDTLAGYNARAMMGQGLSAATPRPAPTINRLPSISVPESKPLSIEAQAMGAGFGQGIVAMSPRPAPMQMNIPRLDIPIGSFAQDYALQNYDLMGQGITPAAQYLRPTSPMEVYAPAAAPNVGGLDRMKPEMMMGSVNAHQPTMNFGGDPRFEAEMASIRPTNPRMMTRAPTVNISAAERRIPIRELPLIPASTQPRVPNVSKLIGPVKAIKMEAQYVAPPVRNADLGGMLNSTSRVGGFGNSSGRTFGSEGPLSMRL